jgi:hypothetical protein
MSQLLDSKLPGYELLVVAGHSSWVLVRQLGVPPFVGAISATLEPLVHHKRQTHKAEQKGCCHDDKSKHH